MYSLIAWSAQVAILTAAAAIAARTIADPKGRLALWQGSLLIALLLPVIEPWKTAPPPVAAPAAQTAVSIVSAAAATSHWTLHWRAEYWLWLLAAGAALRLAWMAAGFLRLRHYRRHARPIPDPPRFGNRSIASRSITWFSSDSVPGPVTYGWLRPVILLPSRTLALPADLCEAIQCHELIHVRRGDWLWVLLETAIRSLLWFHPAIWFVMNRIQLTREQAVDQEAVRLLRNRDRYLDALLAVAADRLAPDLAPAPLFLRKRHLLARVEAVLKEVHMSRPRTVAAIAAVCSLLPLAGFAAAWLFPFMGPAPIRAQEFAGNMITATAPDSPGVSVEAGAVLLHRAPVRAPQVSTAGGKVLLEATLDAQGEVTDARVISGPQELRNAALSSVLQWHYEPGPSVAEIGVQFAASAVSTSVAAAPVRVARPAPSPAPAASTPTLQRIEFAGISAEAEQSLRSLLTVREGDQLTSSDMTAITTAVHNFDGHLGAEFTIGNNGVTQLRIATSPRATPTLTAQSARPVEPESARAAEPAAEPVAQPAPVPGVTFTAHSAPPTPAPEQPAVTPRGGVYRPGGDVYRPGGDVSNPIPLTRPEPQYSEEARAAKWAGTVLLSLVVDETGHTRNIHVLKPLGLGLDEKAIEAVSKWTFRPGTKGGNPVSVQAQIEVTFRLL